MRAADIVLVQIEIVEWILLVIASQQSVSLVGPVNREPIEGETDDRRVLKTFVAPRRLHADWILMVVVLTSWARVTAATIQSPRRIGFENVIERIEENHTVGRDSDRTHRQGLIFVLRIHRDVFRVDFWVDRNRPLCGLFLNVCRVPVKHSPSIREGCRWMVRQIFAGHHDVFFGNCNDQVVWSVLVFVDDLSVQILVACSQPGSHVPRERSFEFPRLVEQLLRVGVIELSRQRFVAALRIEVPTATKVNSPSSIQLLSEPCVALANGRGEFVTVGEEETRTSNKV